jgi:hypothetical protein
VVVFPIVHGFDEECLQLIKSMIEPKSVPELILIHANKINLVFHIVGSLDKLEELFWELVFKLEPLNSSLKMSIIVLLDNTVSLILCIARVFLPKVHELGIRHKEHIFIKLQLNSCQLHIWVLFS